MSKPRSRTFRIFEHIKSGVGEGLLDIPHPVVLQYKTPESLVADFSKAWQVDPKGVILPVVVPDGLLLECPGLGMPISPAIGSFTAPFDFAETVKRFGQLVPTIYLSVDPTFGFVKTDALHLVDIVGSGSAQVCIGNPRTRELLAAVLGMAIDKVIAVLGNSSAQLAGAVIDVCDIWPMSASDKRIELTCFCESCVKFFDFEEPDLLRMFRTFPNPWNLVLRDSGTGISYISEIPKSIEPSGVVGLSRQRGFLDVFKDASEPAGLVQMARDLLRYIEVRHAQTVQSLHDIFDQAFDDLDEYHLKRIILTEGEEYNWTAGLQLERLDSCSTPGGLRPFDEIWFNPTSSDLFTRNVDFRSYMWRRARYLIDAFLETVASATDPVKRATTGIARLSEPQIRDLLRRRLRQATSTADTELTSLAALPKLKGTDPNGSQRVGFVGGALTEDIGERFIKDIRIPESGQERLVPGEGEGSLLEALKKLMSENHEE